MSETAYDTHPARGYDEPDDTPEIGRAEMRLADTISRLDAIIEVLGHRIHRVLTPPVPVDPSDKLTAAPQPRSEVADFLHTQADRLEISIAVLADLDRRVGL